MTVSSETSRVEYAGNGSTTAFSITFPYQAKSDISVTLITDATEAETAWALTTNYTLSDPGATGTLTALVAPASGYTLRIERDVPITQTTDLVENDNLPSETLENTFDRLVMIDQQIQRQIDDIYTDPPSARAFLSGIIAPADTLGSDGDTYLDTVTGLTYVKASGTWALDGGDLTGPQGAPGTTTVTGGVTGDTSSTVGNIATFDTTLGTSIEDSGVAVSNVVLKTGAQTIAGAKTFNDTFIVDDAATITGAATVSGALNVAGTGTFDGDLYALKVVPYSDNAGAAAGPELTLYRDSASPADNDETGVIYFLGEDDGGNSTTYSQIASRILDVTNTTEDGALKISTMNAGTVTAQADIANGIVIGAATGGFQGAGTVNATAFYVNGSALSTGKLAQVVTGTYATTNSISGAVAYDNSIPQNSEGEEILTLAITPTAASSTLYITCEVPTLVSVPANASPSTGAAIASLFVDTTANALAAQVGCRVSGLSSTDTLAAENAIVFTHAVSAASTSARTYKIRVGVMTVVAGGATVSVTVNPTATLGGVRLARMTIMEVLA